jgi:predicted nucleic acid-binding protein
VASDEQERLNGTAEEEPPAANGAFAPADGDVAEAIPPDDAATASTPVALRAEEAVEATAIFIDSSAIVALVDRDDASHEAAVGAYRELIRAGYKLFTTNYVVAETFDLLRTGVGPLVARQFLRDSKLAVYHADEGDERRARRLVLDAHGGGNLTLVDAISLVVMERLGVADAFAVDPSFLADGR